MDKNVVRKLIESGVSFTEDSQAKAEKLVKELVKSGELRRKDAEKAVQALVERGKSTSEHIVSLVQREVAKQMDRFGGRVDGLEKRLDDVARQVGVTKKAAPAKKAAPGAS